MKRIKSGLIMLGSMFIASLPVLVMTSQFTDLVGWVREIVVVRMGIAGVVWAFLAVVIAQLWMQYLNYRKDLKEAPLGHINGSRTDREYY